MKCLVAIVLGIPPLVVGFVLCMTGIGIPFGIPIMMLSGVPLARVVRKHIRNQFREGPLDQGPKPWE